MFFETFINILGATAYIMLNLIETFNYLVYLEVENPDANRKLNFYRLFVIPGILFAIIIYFVGNFLKSPVTSVHEFLSTPFSDIISFKIKIERK